MAKKDTWSKPPKKSWMSTLAFQRFRQKHGNLSRIYWSWQLGLNAVRNLTANAQSSDFVVDVVGTDFKRGMIPDTCQEFEVSSLSLVDLLCKSRGIPTGLHSIVCR